MALLLHRWRKGLRLAETAIVLGFWAGGVAASDPVIAASIFVVGAIIGLLAIAAEQKASVRFKVVLAGAMIVFFAIGGGLVWARHTSTTPATQARPQPASPQVVREIDRYYPVPSPQTPEKLPPSDTQVVPKPSGAAVVRLALDCSPGQTPAYVPPSQHWDIVVLPTFSGEGADIGAGQMGMQQPAGTPIKRDMDYDPAIVCSLTNYGSDALASVTMPFDMVTQQTTVNGTEIRGGPPIAVMPRRLHLGRIEPGVGNPYVFYVQNLSDNYQTMVWKTGVKATDLDDKPISVKLAFPKWYSERGLAVTPRPLMKKIDLDKPKP